MIQISNRIKNIKKIYLIFVDNLIKKLDEKRHCLMKNKNKKKQQKNKNNNDKIYKYR